MPKTKKQKRPARITSFPFFPRLPLEIQDEIWKFALENDVPAAHIVNIDLEYPSNKDPAHLLLQRLVATGYSSRFTKPVSPPRQALVQTCYRSRLMVKKIIETWECYHHRDAQSMDYPCLNEYDEFHSTTPLEIAPPQPKMYTSRDLFIISNPWLAGRLILFDGFSSHSTSVKYVALPYSTIKMPWYHFSRGPERPVIDEIFRVFDNLETLYILIHPDKLYKRDQLEISSLVRPMQIHLKTYKRTRKDTSPRRFQYGDRVYHEISDVLLTKLNQFRALSMAVTDMAMVAKAQREKNGGDKPPLVIRFMTW
ncbi:hypothetical protein NXS19_004200 [Fusarium pseudograminearum]|nr:hypothetical protein NXS19_004200 [Fusarium pseudograminearum]